MHSTCQTVQTPLCLPLLSLLADHLTKNTRINLDESQISDCLITCTVEPLDHRPPLESHWCGRIRGRDSSGARLFVNAAPTCQKAHHFLPRVPWSRVTFYRLCHMIVINKKLNNKTEKTRGLPCSAPISAPSVLFRICYESLI